MSEHGFKCSDWFYEHKNGFTIGFLFVKSLIDDQSDEVDIFYKDTRIYKLPISSFEELKFLFELITKEELKRNDG